MRRLSAFLRAVRRRRAYNAAVAAGEFDAEALAWYRAASPVIARIWALD